ncbi:MAG: DUF1127 domain-containing protein [Proteobacteria bacterium]|nr:DUF1127 domain-containing protein [Pseudomonadota bacterium]
MPWVAAAIAVFGRLRARWRLARIERIELLHLTDMQLRDIGLNRLDVRQLADATWWQDAEGLSERKNR